MKKILLLGAATLALSLSGPVSAQDNHQDAPSTVAEEGAKELDAFTKLFENMFTKDETPIDPALLSKGERVAAAIVPKGSYRKIMAETFQKVIEPMMAGMDQIPLSTIASFAGVREEDIALKDGATLSELMAIFDPYYKQRNQSMMSQITDILIDMSDDMEPPIRAGMAQAYARRFSAAELETAAKFYETDTGAKIAGESLAIFASPEVMSASMEMMPKFMERLFGAMEEISKGSDDIPPPRRFSDLNQEELKKLNELLGIEAGSADDDADDPVEEDAVDWTDPARWSDEDRAAVRKLEADSDAAFDKYLEALDAAKENARKRLQKD
ncbi:MAG: DUF2059 domain-containing protein [Parasphingorhabdus sp.]